MKVRIAGIVKESIVDGPGLRTAIFAQGCSHQCKECHNPDTWAYDGGQLVEVRELMEEIKKAKLISGVTLSGGEPFDQAEGFSEIARECKRLGLSVITYTGYTLEEILSEKDRAGWQSLLENTDLLVDGPFEVELKDLKLPYRGSKNQRMINVIETLKGNKIVLYEKT